MSRLDEIVRAKQREVEALRESTHPGHLRSEGIPSSQDVVGLESRPKAMLKIAFDARKFGDYGIGTYIRALLDGFAVHPSQPSLTLFGLRDGAGRLSIPQNWSFRSVPYRPYGLGEFFRMGAEVRGSRCDLFHSPHYTVPLSPGIPTIVTVQDLIQLRFPAIFSPIQRAYAKFMVAHALRTAVLVVTPSEATKADLVSLFHAHEHRIKVIPLGVDPAFRPCSQERIDLIRQKHRLPDRYVLFVGNPKPHKGIVQLLQAMKTISRQYNDLSLVIAGGTQVDKTRIHG
ncbi:MAG: glycosyltransferase family 1 protein, partial [Bacteroidota bacterium]